MFFLSQKHFQFPDFLVIQVVEFFCRRHIKFFFKFLLLSSRYAQKFNDSASFVSCLQERSIKVEIFLCSNYNIELQFIFNQMKSKLHQYIKKQSSKTHRITFIKVYQMLTRLVCHSIHFLILKISST